MGEVKGPRGVKRLQKRLFIPTLYIPKHHGPMSQQMIT
jgi:hypothetical protein